MSLVHLFASKNQAPQKGIGETHQTVDACPRDAIRVDLQPFLEIEPQPLGKAALQHIDTDILNPLP